jgi:photosystem II stability/assembly factor-like uncharacterized protein
VILGALALGSREAAAQGEHRWGGLLFDAFAREASGGGVEAWTAEDGGRIRYRNPSTGAWTEQDVPDEVIDTLHRVFFLPSSSTGWAVGKGGWVLKTTNGGSTWTAIGDRIVSQAGSGDDPYEELFDIHFVSTTEGYLVGLHSIWFSDDGGVDWTDLGDPYNEATQENLNLALTYVELYSIDIQIRSDGSRLGLIVGQPGVVIRCEKPSNDPELDDWTIPWEVSTLCEEDPCGGSTSLLEECACDICPGGEEHEGPWFEAWDVDIGSDEEDPLALFVGGVGSQCGMIFASTDEGISWDPESHECRCSGTGCINCTGNANYNDDPLNATDLNRHQEFKTLYGVEMLEDNSAFAAGYNGQMLVRYAANPVWKDRSIFAAGVPTVPGTVTFPLIGATAIDLQAGGHRAIITGEGGHILETTNGGDAWSQPTIGEPHRIADVFFKDVDVGWHVGQFFRIAQTENGGVSWFEQTPLSASSSQGTFQSVAFASTTDMHGVAVGDKHYPGTTSVPKIRYTDSFLQLTDDWEEDVAFQGAGTTFVDSYLDGKGLTRVTWVTGEEFWAVGNSGLIVKSTNGGQFWRLVLPESSSTLSDFQMEGVAFVSGSTTALIVGRRPVSGVLKAAAYQYKDVGGTVTWTSLNMPSGLTVDGLWDVAISGSTAWFVGEQTVGGDKEGVVLSSTLSSGDFGALSDMTPSAGIPFCLTGADRVNVPVLMEVEVAPNTNAVWTGGGCGRLWSRSSGGAWAQVKSATDAHILGLSFVPEGSSARGFIGGFRASQTQQCITSVQ